MIIRGISASAKCGLLAAALLLVSCASFGPSLGERRVLLLGNSVIYTNNLPAVLARIGDATPRGTSYRFDMVARGGATLTELARDARVVQLLESGRYEAIVFQERGGDDLCMLEPRNRDSIDCQTLVESHVGLANKARANGARVLYLGTYQLAPAASKALVRAERMLADRMGATYVEVSERLQKLRRSAPDLPWLHEDNGHPGVATTALMGVLIHQSLDADAIAPLWLCTGAEMYTPRWSHEGVALHADLVSDVQPVRCLLDPLQMTLIAKGAATGSAAVGGQ